MEKNNTRLAFALGVGSFLCLLTVFGLRSCDLVLEVDPEIIQTEIYDPAAVKYPVLGQSVILYLDHSTCVIDARKNSAGVFNALRPQLGQYSDTLVLLKGPVLDTIPLNRSANKVFETLETINTDIPFSNIIKAVEQITNGNQQAILITDCEFVENNGLGGLWHDRDPYLSEPFKHWLQKGYVIYLVVEPYKEKYKGREYDKKLFYFFFTDDKLNAPISGNMLNELQPHLQSNACRLFKLTNSDIFVERNGDMVNSNLSFTFESRNGFDYIAIDDKWKSIREYVMMLDKYGEPIPGETPEPLIEKLFFNDGNNYVIRDVEIVATGITSKYLSIDCNAADNLKLDCDEIKPNDTDMSKGFELDKDALRNRELKMFLTDKIFDYLTDEYSGNLIRLDFVVTQASLQPYDADMFSWQSLYSNEDAICVGKSIDNVLMDVDIVPMSTNRRIIHTVFIKADAYK